MGLLERNGGWQRCQEYLDVEWMGGRGLIQVDDVDDAALAAVEIGSLLVRRDGSAGGAGRLGRLVCSEVVFVGPADQDVLVRDNQAAGCVGPEGYNEL